ncbi:putative Oxidoreductase, 2OG-Fe(II) oxygenase family [Xenorhabdus bovienii str. puntauvense]|uniref:Putative Oxidoreductase, 2OG-Fe(II) oxygenase family n=1 Tax=Xenorhabdus bovienii str. puntauvense TaxID=1398201 RepID=A0A077NHH5_XENBV|nr:2OG-Fe(II) oxygenase [Xenorhabdus bovienii]CDG97942.1 putative Oxidoreductase, 2OG-Fe(II) oxygenase family [Xenorhabdus bovienii str. puntauvense]
MAEVLNLNALKRMKLNHDPSPWAMCDNTFQKTISADMFPVSHWTYHSQRQLAEALGKTGSDEWYQHNVKTRPLLELGETEPYAPDELADIWLVVAGDLLSDDYRECISDVSEYDVSKLQFQAHFWEFGPGSFFQPHVDKPHKIVTHLMYLTDDWVPEMGGCLQLLRSADPKDVVVEIAPKKNTSAIIRRTDSAWHAVTSIPKEIQSVRKVLQVWFWDKPVV